MPETAQRRKSFDDFQSLQELFHGTEMKPAGSTTNRDSSSLDDCGPKRKKSLRKISVKVKAGDMDMDILNGERKDQEQIQEAIRLMKADLKHKINAELGRCLSSTDASDDRSPGGVRRSRSKGTKEIDEQNGRGRARSVTRKKSGHELENRSNRSKSRSRKLERVDSRRMQLDDGSETSQRSKLSRHLSVAPNCDEDEYERSHRSESSWTSFGDGSLDQFDDDEVEHSRRRSKSLSRLQHPLRVKRPDLDIAGKVQQCNSCHRLRNLDHEFEQSQRSRLSRTVDQLEDIHANDADRHQRHYRAMSPPRNQARSKSLGRNHEDSSKHSRLSRPSRGSSIDRRPAFQARGSGDNEGQAENIHIPRRNKSISRNSLRSKSLGRNVDDKSDCCFNQFVDPDFKENCKHNAACIREKDCSHPDGFDELRTDYGINHSEVIRSSSIPTNAQDTDGSGRRQRLDGEVDKEESRVQRCRSMSLGRRVRRNNSKKGENTSVRHEIARSKSLVRRKSYIGMKGKTLTKDDVAEFMKKAHHSMNASSSGWNYDHEDEEEHEKHDIG
jgi:hypothetical protein